VTRMACAAAWVAVALGGTAAGEPAAPSAGVLVANKSDHTLGIVDRGLAPPLP
jgi:hypothetical protein